MIFAFISAIANSAENVFDKMILGCKTVSYKQFLPITITTIFLLSLLASPFLGHIDGSFFTAKYLFIFCAEIVVAFLYNIFFFYSMKKEELCDVEPFVLLDRPLTVIMAALIFPSERSIYPLIFTLIAATVLIASRVKKHHFNFKFKKSTLALVGFVILISIESQLAKVLLEVLSPVSLYAIRTGFLTVLFWAFLRPNLSLVTATSKRNIIVDGIITFVEFIARFYAIMYLGVVQSTLVLLLSPVITLLLSKFYLKEHLTFKKIAADSIIVLCIVATIFIR